MSEQTTGQGMKLFIAYFADRVPGRVFMTVPENEITQALIERIERMIEKDLQEKGARALVVIISIQKIAG